MRPLGGGAPEVIAADVGSPISVSVDAARVYTLPESRVQSSAPCFAALTFIASAGDILSFDQPRP